MSELREAQYGQRGALAACRVCVGGWPESGRGGVGACVNIHCSVLYAREAAGERVRAAERLVGEGGEFFKTQG